jgi:hypothetical protein
MKISAIGWFVSPQEKDDEISALQLIGCGFLIIGTIFLPLQVGQGPYFSRFHLQWADVFLGIALVMGALVRRSQVIQIG